jgi:predicted lipid-binding transport protein (Tim44 family)
MKKLLSFMILALTLGLASMDSDAAKRFGGGNNLGKQRATPTQREAAPAAAPAAPAQAAKPAPAATPPGVPPPKPSFMQRWGGLLMGLGIGAVLASLFGAQMGPIVGMLLLGLLVVGAIFLVMRLMAGRRPATEPALERRTDPMYAAEQPPRGDFSGIGTRVSENAAEQTGQWSNTSAITSARSNSDPAAVLGGPVEPFLRVAKTSFLRLQAANDAGDLDDIRDFTTPEMYAEIAMQIRDRGDVPQKTEVVSVDNSMADAAIEGDYAYASVRFWGLTREAPGANPEPFDEIWHVRRKANNPKDPWVIAGIQQAG